MRIMTGSAFPFCIGRMGVFELFGESGVAGKTGFCRTGLEKIGLIRRMRVVTGKTLPFPNGSMDDRLLQIFAHLRMTGIAQFGNLSLQHAGVTGNMRVVTGAALPFGHRIMLDPLLKIDTLMTGETVDSG